LQTETDIDTGGTPRMSSLMAFRRLWIGAVIVVGIVSS